LRERRFEDVARGFAQLSAEYPDDRLVQHFNDRALQYKDAPPEGDPTTFTLPGK